MSTDYFGASDDPGFLVRTRRRFAKEPHCEVEAKLNVAIDRDKTLQNAQKLVDKKKYDRAILEYQKIIAQDPRDARTLLKVGDLQSRVEDYPAAIATYDRVAQFYAAQGFSLKAIAVYKQIRELIRKHAPHLADRYGHIVPRLADIYTQLGLTTDALAAYDEVATRYQKANRDRDAIDVFKKMVSLDAQNPVPHLRLAEACCRVQSVGDAIDSFWTASELLLEMARPDDALKVIERILHFRQEPVYARAAAELYLKKHSREGGMQALAKLQIAFQADPKNLDTLHLLAEAFQTINQSDKAFAVHIEMARIAREQGKAELFGELLDHLQSVAPNDEQVLALAKAGPPQSTAPESLSSAPAPAAPAASAPMASAPTASAPVSSAPPEEAVDLDDEVEFIDDEAESLPPEPAVDVNVARMARPAMTSAPDVEVIEDGVEFIDDGAELAEEIASPQSFDAAQHAAKAIVDAESFRRLGLYDKAIEALHIALEIDPNSIDIRHKLREILVETGEREPAIIETLNIATIHLHQSEPDDAEALIREVLEIEPDHPTSLEMLRQVAAVRENLLPFSEAEPLPSYDLEGIHPSQAMASPVMTAPDAPFADEMPLPSFPLNEAPSETQLATPGESLEEVLEEAEFFAAQGLFADAEAILLDQLVRSPHHPLLLERLDEVRDARDGAQQGSRTIERDRLANPPSDHSFDIAASLDALDNLEQPAKKPRLGAPAEEVDVDQVFEKFKEGVKAQVAESDAATHYDLGVAYKEMGLFSDARNEFELASRDPARACMCFAMIGMIHLEQNDLEQATEAYVKALEAEQKTVEQEMSLYYDLGTVYEMREDPKSALYYFEKIARRDPGYRDVKDRIAQLKPQTAAPAPKAKAVGDDDDFDAVFDELFNPK